MAEVIEIDFQFHYRAATNPMSIEEGQAQKRNFTLYSPYFTGLLECLGSIVGQNFWRHRNVPTVWC
jgi:hypothetical protein